MTTALRYDPSAALSLLPRGCVEALQPQLESARAEVAADVTLFESGGDVPAEKEPLDAGFIPSSACCASESTLLPSK